VSPPLQALEDYLYVKKAMFSNADSIIFGSDITEFIPEGASENYEIRVIC